MPNHIKYRGLKHYPSGNAKLEVRDKRLNISGLNRTLDGILIETGGANALNISLAPVSIKNETVLGATFNVHDRLKGIRTATQLVMMQCGESSACLLLNSKLEGKGIQFTAKKQDRPLFTKAYVRSGHPKDNWIKVASFNLLDGPLTVSNIDYQTGFTYCTEGLITGTTITRSFRCNGLLYDEGSVASSKATGVPVCYEVDELKIVSTTLFPVGQPSQQLVSMSQVILTGQGLAQFSILDEHHSKAS